MDDGTNWEGEQDHMEWKVDTSEVVVSHREGGNCLSVCVVVCVCTYVCVSVVGVSIYMYVCMCLYMSAGAHRDYENWIP